MARGDRIAVFRDGQIEQIGSPHDVYHHPLNGYCARLFGPANCVLQTDEKTQWIRPEDMELRAEKEDDFDMKVEVIETRDTGRTLEARVQRDQETWVIPISKDSVLGNGQSAWVSLKAE